MKRDFKKGERMTLFSAGTTLTLAGLKAVVGLISGSVVLVGDAIHSAADSMSSFAAWFGIKIAQKKPTEKFPYGFYKAENLAALAISGLIIFAGVSIIRESIDKLTTQYELGIPLLAIGVAVLDGIVMYFVGNREIKVGKEINSQSLVADGKESKIHVLSSAVVIIGLGASWFSVPYLEGIMGIIISLFIFQAGLESLKDSVLALMDVSPDKDKEEEIKKVLNECGEVQDFEDLKLRSAGPFIFGEVKVRVARSIEVKRASEAMENLQAKVNQNFPEIDSFVVTILPSKTEKQKLAVPIKEDSGLNSRVSYHFGKGRYFIFVTLDKDGVKDYYVKENPYHDQEKRVGVNTAAFLAEEKVTSLAVFEIGESPFHTLRDKGIDIFMAQKGEVKELIDKFKNEELEIIREANREQDVKN